VRLNSPANDWAALDRALSELAASGSVEVREDGEWLAELATLHFELRVEHKNPLVHLWSDERNLNRRVLRVRENAGDRIVLEVQRFGRAKPGRLEFLRTDSPRAAGRITREQFRARCARILAEKFPDAVVDSLTAAPDLENSFSGSYVRGIMHEGSHAWALLAAAPSEDAATVENILAIGILWVDWTRTRAEPSKACASSSRGELASASVNACSRSLHPCAQKSTKCASRTPPCNELTPPMPETWKVGWSHTSRSNSCCMPRTRQSGASERCCPAMQARSNAGSRPPRTKSR
jgi:DNA-binding transcriptional ArsR family regulator